MNDEPSIDGPVVNEGGDEAADTPAGFRFCPKVPKAISHSGALARQPTVTLVIGSGSGMRGSCRA